MCVAVELAGSGGVGVRDWVWEDGKWGRGMMIRLMLAMMDDFVSDWTKEMRVSSENEGQLY